MFETFPTAQEFARQAGISPAHAEVILSYIAEMAGKEYTVSRRACEMAVHALRAGMDWQHVTVIFASNYRDYYRTAIEHGIDVTGWHKPFNEVQYER
jgi:hypothetical protein